LRPGLLRAYDEPRLGKLAADASCERPAMPCAVMLVVTGARAGLRLSTTGRAQRHCRGASGPPSLKTLLRESPDQVLNACRQTIEVRNCWPLLPKNVQSSRPSGGAPPPFWVRKILFGTGNTAHPQELGHFSPCARSCERREFEARCRRHRPSPRPGRREVPTRFSTRTPTPRRVFPSSLVDPAASKPCCIQKNAAGLHGKIGQIDPSFDLKYERDELLLLSRDEKSVPASSQTFCVALLARPIASTFSKDAALP